MKKWIAIFDFLCLSLVLVLISRGTSIQQHTTAQQAVPVPQLVVLADPEDPYTVLADEIAQAENALRLGTVAELADIDALYVIYVASPEWLTESKLIALSTLSAQTGHYPAVGIISGSTLAQARALWQRSSEVNNGTGFSASAIDVNGGVDEDLIWNQSTGQVTTLPMTKANLLQTLESADYLYWARHAATTNWFWYEGDYPVDGQWIAGDDLPDLKPVVIHSPSCRSFLPWAEDSIALAFTDHGAAAYLGHLYSPISSGYFIGHLQTLPGYNTWPGFSMGMLAQVQNRASGRAFATQPYFFMLGDPRIALQSGAPYTITSDTQQGNRRIIQGYWESAGATPGVLPLRIAEGATYEFTKVKGIGAIGDNDPFYNRSIQPLNVQGDKVILILHPDGEFEVELRTTAPLFWRQMDALRDALEFVWCSIATMQSPLGLLPLGLLLVVGTVKVLRKKSLRPYLPTLYAGIGWATIQLAFCILRSGKVSITSYLINPTPIELIFAFVGTTGFAVLGLVWMLDARRFIGKILGLVVCVAPSVALTGFYTAIITMLNTSMARKSTEGFWPLSYNSVQMAVIVLLIEVMLFFNTYLLLRKSTQLNY